MASTLAVPWIDLKNPALGSLGRPEVATGPTASHCSRSVALGELRTLEITAAAELMRLFPVCKIGLAGLASHGGANSELEQQLAGFRRQFE